MVLLINFFAAPIAYILEKRSRIIAASLAISLVVVPAYLIGSVIYAEAKLDEVKIVRESNSPEVLKDGLQSSRFIGPKVSKSQVISSVEDLQSN